jgi:hypothetical protein
MAFQKRPSTSCARPSIASGINCRPRSAAAPRHRSQHVAQRGDQPLKAVLMTNTALQFNGDLRQHVTEKLIPPPVILTIHIVILTF